MDTRRADQRTSRRARRAAWLVALTFACLPGRDAYAGDSKAADEHFKRGKELLARGRVAEACAELATSDALDPSVGTLGLLAACHEKLGKVATAYREYAETEKRARAGRDERAEFAKAQAERLAAVVP